MEGRVVGRRPRRSRVEGACDADVATDGNVVTKQPGEEDIIPPIVYLRVQVQVQVQVARLRGWSGVIVERPVSRGRGHGAASQVRFRVGSW